MKQKRMLSLLITLAMILPLLPVNTVFAEDAYSYIDYTWNDSTKSLAESTKTVSNATVLTEDMTTWTDGWYVAAGKIEFAQVNRINVEGEVHLILTDGAELIADGGIELASGNTLYIYAQSTDDSSMGKLSAYIASHASTMRGKAGIGGSDGGDGGNLIINGGRVTGRSYGYAAGIGGSDGGSGGEVTINGGIVTAYSGICGAGIGGSVSTTGKVGNGGTVTINGGVVNATGGVKTPGMTTCNTCSAGIGGGGGNGSNGGSGGTVIIRGGSVTAKCRGEIGNGIGNGQGTRGNINSVTISGGNVNAIVGTSGGYAIGCDTKDGDGNAVLLKTYTIDRLEEQKKVTSVEGIGDYCIRDISTLDTNKLYFYLTESTAVTKVTTEDGRAYVPKNPGDTTLYCVHQADANGFCTYCGAYSDGDTAYDVPTKNGEVYEIYSAEDLHWFEKYVNIKDSGINGKLMNNIDLESKALTPIGSDSKKYGGTFDGNNFEIKNLKIDDTSGYTGLFGVIDTTGTVENLTITGSVKGKNSVGGIAGKNCGKIENCTNNASIDCVNKDRTSNVFTGGIVGVNEGRVLKCVNFKDICANDVGSGSASSSTTIMGGMVGKNNSENAEIINCMNLCSRIDSRVESYNTKLYCGGIVGENNSGTVKNCFSVSNIIETIFFGSTSIKGFYKGGIAGNNNATVENCYYKKQKYVSSGINGQDYKGQAEIKSDEQIANGEVAWLLQNGQTDKDTLVWGQHLSNTAEEGETSNKDDYPVWTTEAYKKVYKVAQMANPNGGDYTESDAVYGNDNQTVTLKDYDGDYSGRFYGWAAEKDSRTLITEYTVNKADAEVYSVWNELTFDISGEKQTYQTGTTRTITLTPKINGTENENVKASAFEVKYYEVNENTGKLRTTEAVNAISAGKYLYVIGFAENADGTTAQECCNFKNAYSVTDTILPSDLTAYDNIGYMLITSGTESAQKPIYFEDGTVNLKVGGTFENKLTNENGTTPEIKSSNESVATVTFADGKVTVTAIGKGTATITATSTKDKTTPVYASFTVNVGLATKALAADDFNVVATSKTYDETDSVKLTATLKDGVAYEGDNLKFDITGKFENADAGEDKKVSYEITDITGTGAENYALENDKITVSAENSTVKANIAKAQVTIICSETTTRTYDGNAQTVDVSAMANGKVFDKSNYTILYNNKAAVNTENEKYPSAVASYPVTIELKSGAAKNYEVTQPTATLVIKSATQDVFSIEGVPEVVYYGDTFELSNSGATGDVTYKADESKVLTITGTTAVANKTGKVTITATSTKGGYNDRVATKTIEVKKRILTPTATATGKTYDGKNTVDVSVALDNIVKSGDVSTNTTTGTMANADAGNGKIVYVSGIELTGDKKEYYTLSTTSLQTTVDIAKAEITGFTVSANDKKYDGTANATATATLTEDNGILADDIGQVEIVGSAEFDSKDSGDRTVTFTATGELSGAKSQNYKFKDNDAKTATKTAKIEPLKVDFVIGQTTFVYDEKDKEISVSASDENGKIFKDYSISYTKGGESATLNEVGTYTATVKLKNTTNYYTVEQGTVEIDVPVTISKATQDSLVIVSLPGTIQYGDSFELEAVGGEDGGSYQWTSDNENVKIQKSETDETDGSALAKPYIKINGAVGKTVAISVTKTVANYEPITAKVVFVPTAKTVTFDISNVEQTYDGNEKKVSIKPTDDDLDLEENTDYTVTYNGKADLPTNAGTYTVKVMATGNYTGVQTATLTIKKATATGTITGIKNSYTYGNTVDKTKISATSTMGSVTPKITFAGTGIYVPQEAAPTKVGNYTVIAEFKDSNYETLTVTKDFEITKAPLTVKAENAERGYGDANPIFELVYDGFVYEEGEDVLLSEPIATVNANASSPVTDDNTKYYITVSGGNAENYKFVYDNTGELTIEPTGNGTLYITGSSNTVRVGDVFMLYAFYGNSKVNVTWSLKDGSPTDVIELDAKTGKVTAKKHGTVTIIATIADKNYNGEPAEFTLNVKQTGITLVPTGLVKTYTGERQDISFANNADFTPEIGENVKVEYTLISDPTVKEPVRVGTYSVVYTINDDSYTGGGNTTMYINKATVTAKVKDDTKVYGDEYTGYDIEITNNGGITNVTALAEVIANIKSATSFASDGAAKTAVVKEGGYEMIPTLSATETDNVKFTVDKGTLTVNKAPLTIKAKDVKREYGAENPVLEAEYNGFKNGETKDVLTGDITLEYKNVGTETPVGIYPKDNVEIKTQTSGTLTAGNYTITYADGNVEITKIAVKASAGTSRASYLTVKFDKAVEGVTFKVTDVNGDVEVTSVTASADNKTYTLNGTFTVGTEYTVEITYDNATQDISNKTLKITPTKQSSGGGGGGNSATTSYTVTFETNGGSKIDSVKVDKNKTVTEPTAPTKDGFEFDGWYSDKKLTTAYDFDTKVTKAITLYAKWTENKPDDNKDDNNNPTPSEWKNPFADVTSADWFFDNVRYVNENGLMSGTTDTTFAPNDNLTRGMLVTVLYRAEGEPAVNKSIPFADVNADMYYSDAVIWAEQNGIVNGITETEFASDENITREQIATIIYRYAEYKGIAPTGAWAIKLDYADVADISDYAVEGVMYCTMKNIMQGKDNNMFAPKDDATRAEIAAILNSFIEGNK